MNSRKRTNPDGRARQHSLCFRQPSLLSSPGNPDVLQKMARSLTDLDPCGKPER